MSENDENTCGSNRALDVLRSTFKAFPSITSFGIVLRSLKEDYPIWIGSMWIIFKQQPRRGTISTDTKSSTKNCERSTISDMKNDLNSIWQNVTLDLVVDSIVLGFLLIYKKACDEKYRRQIGDRDGAKRKGKMNTKVHETKKVATDMETESVEKLRRLLKSNSLDSSQLLSSQMKGAMGLHFDSGHPEMQQQQHTLMTIDSPSTKPSDKASNQKRYIELLVHNVSHTDLVLSLDAPLLPSKSPSVASHTNSQDGSDSYCLCRPRFSAFDGYSQRLVDFSKDNKHQMSEESLIRFPRYERNDETQQPEPTSKKVEEKIPIGFQFRDEGEKNEGGRPIQISSSDLKDLRVRGRDAQRVLNCSTSASGGLLSINAVFFPLLATLMPLWMSKIVEKYGNHRTSKTAAFAKPKLVLILVSGVGQPRNWTHCSKGNSTEKCAELMKIFLQTIYPELVVVHIHSDTNIFRYDENITFVQNELLPRIQEYRDAHAKGMPYPDEVTDSLLSEIDVAYKNQSFSTEWRKSFSITLSFADGSPARNHAIQAALRTFKPMYYHFWQLKTFWHESKIVNSDIEVHSFEEMETLPPVETDQLHGRPLVKRVVEEMKLFRDDFVRILSDTSENSDDIRTFWLRKTLKPVIAILAVQRPNGEVKLYRGTNMEVSMPTGSLCAERNVIGTALADNPSLKRQDLKMIAVLAIPNPRQTENSTKNIAQRRVHSTNSLTSMITATSEEEFSIGKPPYIPSRKSSLGEEEEWAVGTRCSVTGQQSPFVNDKKPSQSGSVNLGIFPQSNPSIESSEPPSPARTVYLYNKLQNQSRKQRRAVVIHSDADINPLRPCGACNEWLKKLAETNPYFTILTFTDSACNGVYCTPCEE